MIAANSAVSCRQQQQRLLSALNPPFKHTRTGTDGSAAETCMIRRVAMATEKDVSGVELTPRVRIALFKNCLPVNEALELGAESITFKLLKSYGVSASSIRVAGVTPTQLKSIGCSTALELRALGFDALDLGQPSFCANAIMAFGASDVKTSFLTTEGDAVCIAGSTAQHQLEVTSQELLAACAGSPRHAESVLQMLAPRGRALHGCSVHTLLDTGVRGKALVSLGYFADLVKEQTGASDEELTKLGF